MSIRFVTLILLALSLVITTASFARKAVVVPDGDGGYSVISLPEEDVAPPPVPAGVILFDALTDGTTQAQRPFGAGAFSPRGWQHVEGYSKLVYDLGANRKMESGIIEFELTNMSANTRGGYLGQPGSERAYYFGLFNSPTGNKGHGGGNPAFIEIRYNWGSYYRNNGLSAVKFQAGDRGLLGGRHEEIFGVKPWGTWNPLQYYRHRVEFGGGVARLYIDDVLQVTIGYTNRAIGWRYLMIGDINYAGMTGPDNVIYRNVKVTKIN